GLGLGRHVLHLGGLGGGQFGFQLAVLLLDRVDHVVVFVHQWLVFLISVGQAVDQRSQLPLGLVDLGLVRQDLGLGLAFFGQVAGDAAPDLYIFTAFGKDRILPFFCIHHQRHLASPLSRGGGRALPGPPCYKSSIPHFAAGCNNPGAAFTVL